jgi:hypothetical protein
MEAAPLCGPLLRKSDREEGSISSIGTSGVDTCIFKLATLVLLLLHSHRRLS